MEFPTTLEEALRFPYDIPIDDEIRMGFMKVVCAANDAELLCLTRLAIAECAHRIAGSNASFEGVHHSIEPVIDLLKESVNATHS